GLHPLELWRTDDGARTWQRMDSQGISGDDFKHLLLFAPPARGFMAVTTADENTWPQVLATDDGRLWQPLTFPAPVYPPRRVAGEGMLRAGARLVLWVQDLDTPPDRLHLYTSAS